MVIPHTRTPIIYTNPSLYCYRLHIMSEYKFQSTVEPKKLEELYAVSGLEWGAPFTAEEFGKHEANQLVKYILSGRAGRGFYLETKLGEIVCTCVISHHKAFYKEPERAALAGVPDPAAFGVGNITALRMSHVFTKKEYRGKGLMARLIEKAIAYTEAEILKKELAKSSDQKDGFKNSVTTDGKVDTTLANYYLGKKYFWFLYSAIGSGYSRFGFKTFPLDGYQIPLALEHTESYKLVEQVLQGLEEHVGYGKKLRFLDGDRKLDRDLIEYILQGRELDLMTDLNKVNFHQDLSGGRRSLSLLTNISSVLSATKLGSTNELSAIAEKLLQTGITPQTENTPQTRRKLSVSAFGIPRVGIKPDFVNLAKYYAEEETIAQQFGTSENVRFSKIKGAILTNELQQKSMYILWTCIMHKQFVIVGMGELKLDLFGALADPSGFTNPVGRRRGLSFTGLNELGGFNFQDLAILVNSAVYTAKHRYGLEPGVFVAVNDLPDTVPTPVLHDFFLNYLPSQNDAVSVADKESSSPEDIVAYIENLGPKMRILPLLRRFGSNLAEFDVDWTGSSLASWG